MDRISAEGGNELPVDQDSFDRALRERGASKEMRERAWTCVDGPAIGVLLYGSWARGEGHSSSDLDMIVLSDSRIPMRAEHKISLSVYSPDQLASASRTLFGMHLARDGVPLHDPWGQLAEILASLEPPNAAELLARVRDLAVVLDASSADRANYLPGLMQLARYLLRTATYAAALVQGAPCFSLAQLAVRFNQPELPVLLSSHADIYPPPSLAGFDDLVGRLEHIVGPCPSNPYGSLQALIVALWDDNPSTATLATLALGADESLPYSELPKVVL